MKLFECIIDDDEQGVFKAFLAAKNKKELTENFIDGGRFDKVTDVTDLYLVPESVGLLHEHLSQKGWGKAEIEIICRLVEEHIRERDEKIRNKYRCGYKTNRKKELEAIRKSNYEKMVENKYM